jgi:hypothetical protein
MHEGKCPPAPCGIKLHVFSLVAVGNNCWNEDMSLNVSSNYSCALCHVVITTYYERLH